MLGHRLSEADVVTELARVMAGTPAPLGILLQTCLSWIGALSVGGAALLDVQQLPEAWHVAASTPGVEDAELDRLTLQLTALSTAGSRWPEPVLLGAPTPEPLQGGSASAVALTDSGSVVGVLVVLGCSPAAWAAIEPSVRNALLMCLARRLVQAAAHAEAVFAKRSADATLRLFREGAFAHDVSEAGTIVARVAAQALQTERAGVEVVDEHGIISFAIGVGVSVEVNDAIQSSLLGKVAADSPGWRLVALASEPQLVDDAKLISSRKRGFIETLGVRSFAAIPLLSRTGLRGIVICGEAARSRHWTQAERDFTARFSLEGALIVDAARLRASERAQLVQLTHQAFHDALTGLPNRSLLMERAAQALASAARRGSRPAILMLDINDFKRVNDIFGHTRGDELLCEIADLLTGTLRSGDTVARLGGDEFAILLPDNADITQAHAVATKVGARLDAPLDVGGIELDAAASIGIAVFPEHGRTAAELIRRADVAMYVAKRMGSGPALYRRAQDDSAVERLRLYRKGRDAETTAATFAHADRPLELPG